MFNRDRDEGEDPGANGDGASSLEVVVEIPKGSRNKYEYDHVTDRIVFDRMLFSAVHYPTDYGFMPGTLAEDGDPLDALVLVYEPTFPGCVIEARPVGLFRMADEKGPDEKVLCVPLTDPQWNHIEGLADVPPHLLKEIEHFFAVYKDLEGKEVDVQGWEGREAAVKTVAACRDRARKGD
ncbi:MAG: inorganic diphosphatase [Candidatus Thermoplasmatota archaeon]|nr:inorganic diphosphatase [Candidatus Thermoplasmatota archaeon]